MSTMSSVNFKLDSDVKKSMEDACKAMGLSMTTAFTIFAKKVGTERRIPFEVAAPDPFYDPRNQAYLNRKIEAYERGELNVNSHNLIELED